MPGGVNAILGFGVSQDQNQQVTVRRLPDGCAHTAFLHSLDGLLLRIDLRPFPAGLDVNPGDLIEVNCLKTLYLGEFRGREGDTMIVGVEHALDRETLALIQQVWHGPANQ